MGSKLPGAKPLLIPLYRRRVGRKGSEDLGGHALTLHEATSKGGMGTRGTHSLVVLERLPRGGETPLVC